MKGKRLGRGLEEVSRVFLSSDAAQTMREMPLPERDPYPPVREGARSPIHAIGVLSGREDRMGIFTLCNVSIELARRGYRVLVVDEDPGGGLNVTRLMGLMDMEGHAESVFGNAPMGVRIAYRAPFQNDLLSHVASDGGRKQFLWPERYRHFDFVLFHLPRGRLGEVGAMLSWVSLCLVLTSTVPSGMLEGYRTIKDMHQRARQIRTGVTVISEKGEEDAAAGFQRLARNVKRFLKKDLVSYSYILRSEVIETSIEEGVPVVLKSPSSETRRLLYNISGLLIEDHDHKDRLRAGSV